MSEAEQGLRQVETAHIMRFLGVEAQRLAKEFIAANASHDCIPLWEDMDAATRVRFAVSFFHAAAVRHGYARGPG